MLQYKYDLVINVNDAYLPRGTPHWCPINEVAQWGYAPFFYVKRLLDNSPAKTILIHCAAGAFRSPLMVYCYLLSLGNDQDDIDNYYAAGEPYRAMYDRCIKDGTIPDDLNWFYKFMKEYPENSLMGILARMNKLG